MTSGEIRASPCLLQIGHRRLTKARIPTRASPVKLWAYWGITSGTRVRVTYRGMRDKASCVTKSSPCLGEDSKKKK